MKKAEIADFPKFEHDILKIWDKEKTFQQSLALRKDAKRFSFYDGPPFANGLPHFGHALASTEKDAITRYKTMRGYYVPRRAGWDTHGLPVEYEVEKTLGISGKKQIMEMGVAKFNEACRASVFKYKTEWEQFFHRFGRWIDLENAYATMDDSYIETVWWVLSQIHKKGLLYRGFKSMPYCPRCATPLSNFELNQGYQDGVEDPSLYVMFQLVDQPHTSILAWTTTPWTLPANAALAVNSEANYVTVELKESGQKLILAKDRIGELDLRKTEYKIISVLKGKELVGLAYEPLYSFVKFKGDEINTTHRIYAADMVSLEDGTGVLHVAPAYGEDDLELGQREGLAIIRSVDGSGMMSPDMGEFAGLFFKKADPQIIADLTKQGKVFAAETFTHTYPFCWRCDTPLFYNATPSWFVKVTTVIDKLVDNNQMINWTPNHVKVGRFGNWLAEARDWSVSRNRFWGAPIPVWVNTKDPDDYLVVGSMDELRSLSGHKGDFDLHRPGIDDVKITLDGKTYQRVEEVFDCWFESGSMPYAEDHYPFENEQGFASKFPADFIAEGLDQTRGWFYTLHVLACALFDQPAFKNVIVNGTIVAADGRKLSKRLKNYPNPNEIFETYGVDSLRFLLASSPAMAGEDVRFSAEAVGEVNRNIFMTLWNVYSFFSTYAEIDKWSPGKDLVEPKSTNVLDEWLLSVVNAVIAEVTVQADGYQINRAVRPLRDLIDDLSNWYVRRSRRRFWKSEDDSDKRQAYATLHYVLLRISQLMAPWSPFVSDKLWRELSTGMELPTSVHLSDWPEAGVVNGDLILQMKEAREIVTIGLAQRAAAGIKVRQPLLECKLSGYAELNSELVDVVAEELNVKNIVQEAAKEVGVQLNTEITQELKLEGLARELIRQIQSKRKAQDLEVDDRIEIRLGAEPGDLAEAAHAYSDLIKRETLAISYHIGGLAEAEIPVRLAGQDITINLKKA